MPLVLVSILLPLVPAAFCYFCPRGDRALSRLLGTAVAAITFATVLAGALRDWSLHWLSRPFVSAFHFGATPISFWIALLLTLCTACAIAAPASSGCATSLRSCSRSKGPCSDSSCRATCWLRALLDLMLVPVFFALVGWGEHPATAWLISSITLPAV